MPRSQRSVPLAVHCFLDGRDTPPRSALALSRAARSETRRMRTRRRDRERHRALLCDGSRPAMGAHQTRLRSAGNGALAEYRTDDARSRGACGLRARRGRRVRAAHDRRRGAPDRGRRRVRLLQLSPRSRAPADDGLQRRDELYFDDGFGVFASKRVSRSVLRHDDEVRRDLYQPGALRSATAIRYVRRDPLARGLASAPAGRDREVRARDVLFQRRTRGPVRRRRSKADSVGSERRHLRSRARDARSRDHRRGSRSASSAAPTTPSS